MSIEMPWIDETKCIGCGLCITKCPVNAISIKEGKAEINMDECIRCGKCHDICPQGAVRHDSERIPVEVEKNVKKIRDLMGDYATKKEKNALLNRMVKHYNKEVNVAEETIKKIKELMV